MRVYVAATPDALQALLSTGSLRVDGPAYAVTPSLRAWATADGPADDEELELVALSEAARHSLRLLVPLDDEARGRRAVVAADVPAGEATVDDEGDEAGPGQVRLPADALPRAWVAAVLVDDEPAATSVRRAVAVISAADDGDEAAERTVAELDDHDLLWFAPAELAALTAAG